MCVAAALASIRRAHDPRFRLFLSLLSRFWSFGVCLSVVYRCRSRDMFSYLTTLLGNNVGLTSSSAILAAPVGGYGALRGIPYNDLQGPLGVQGHRGAQGMRTEASLYVSSLSPFCWQGQSGKG